MQVFLKHDPIISQEPSPLSWKLEKLMVFLMISSIVADTSATGSLSVLAVTASLLLQAPNSWLCCCQQATAALGEKGKSGKSSTKERDKSISTSQSPKFPRELALPRNRERKDQQATHWKYGKGWGLEICSNTWGWHFASFQREWA